VTAGHTRCHHDQVGERLRPVLAWGVFALVCALVTAGGWLSSQTSHGWSQPSDAVLGLSFTAAGALIVTRRRNRLGWLSLLIGLSGLSYAADSYAGWAVQHHVAGAAWVGWIGLWAWAPAWLVMSTVLLLTIPDGHLPGRRWRPLLIVAWLVVALFTVLAAVMPPEGAGHPANPLAGVIPPGLAGLSFTPVLVLLLLLVLGGLAALISRLRRSTGVERLQLVWICAGAVIEAAGFFAGSALPTSVASLVQAVTALALPVGLGTAVLRHNLYEMDPVLRRSLTYGLLAGALAVAALLVISLGGLLAGHGRPVVTVVATIVLALLANPVYRLVNRAVNRLLYGARGDPYAVLSALSRRLSSTTEPGQVLDALASAAARMVRSPYVSVEAADLFRVQRGEPQPVAVSIPLNFQGNRLGWLRLAARSPGEPFDPRDHQLLRDTAAQAGAAVCAAVTELELRAARERLISSREEERRRLRRDLHDGVGPVLAGLSFTAEAAARALPARPDRAAELLSSVHEQAAAAISAVRQISRELRPAPLAELGLTAAIRRLTDPAVDAGLDADVRLPGDLPELPAAVEVAAYHIAAEAVANALRHSRGHRLTVELSQVQGHLLLRVADDGVGLADDRPAGVGLASMRQRAEELGGSCLVGPADGAGTLVMTRLPLPGNEAPPTAGPPTAGPASAAPAGAAPASAMPAGAGPGNEAPGTALAGQTT
jgi:two-component system, NarL family, sensor kinase